jgi:hypothetical protein
MVSSLSNPNNQLLKIQLTPHSTGYKHSLNHGTENLLTLHFNGKI